LDLRRLPAPEDPITPRVLILGGTAEARQLAGELVGAGIPVTSSLAGRVVRPRLPDGDLRIGGFGGPAGLARWLAANRIDAVIDATHPFAETISSSAAEAAGSSGVPLLRLERPGWTARPRDRWTWVADLRQAAAAIRDRGAGRVLLTTGRQGLAAFAGDGASWFLIRCVDPPDVALPPHHQIVLDRGPFTLDGELGLIDRHGIDVVITKDSGGTLTVAKLDAARERRLPVVIVRRPARPPVASVETVAEATAWARRQTGRPAGGASQ
jgi:precorrin-6A/cobalt-precorrin-6A reductase